MLLEKSLPSEGQEFDEKFWLALWNRTWQLEAQWSFLLYFTVVPGEVSGAWESCTYGLTTVKGAYTHSILPAKHNKIVGVTQLFAIPYTFI